MSSLAALLRDLEDLREPVGGYDSVTDRFSNIAVLDHERKTQYRRVVIALQMPHRQTLEKLLQDIEHDFAAYGQLIFRSALEARDVDGHGNTLFNATPISSADQAVFEEQCSILRDRVLDALIASGYVASDPEWLL